MINEQLKQEIAHLCNNYPPAKPVIDAIIESFTTNKGPSQRSLPKDAIKYTEMSMILPTRRKCNVYIHDEGVWVTANEAVVLEFQWSEIIRAACLPVPDKPKPMWNLIFARQDPQTTIVLALGQTSADKHKANSKPQALKDSIMADVELHSSLSVDTQFSLQVKAYIGSKEGYLYFLQDSLIYGHKKPILLLLHKDISSFSFTVITRNTFNVVVKLKDETQYEFSMIEQDDFPRISDYVSAHGLNDESLAIDRAAKRSRPDEDLADDINHTGAILEGRDNAQDDDDRESDLDVEFSDRELDSDGSGLSEDEEEDPQEFNDQIDAIQAQQLDDQLDDEDSEERGFDAMDAYDTNVVP